MLFTILIAVVFISEIIITVTIMRALVNFDRQINEISGLLRESQAGITDIAVLAKGISEQIKELAARAVKKYEYGRNDVLSRYLSKLLLGLFLWKINIKAINKFRKSKLAKSISRGLSMLEFVV